MRTSDVLLHFGSKTNTGKALGISKAAISQWGENVPQLRAYQIEKITGGELKCDPSFTPFKEHKKAS
ncbi:MAG: DNA-binding transcriptional regulator YdaS (Cro superfamily) [Cognaticolwellia sp.]|jgi:DNA-binding transcriptional regulator YdaS (Cro superfamily)